MTMTEPTTELDTRYSTSDATAVAWAEASAQLERAETYWLSTVRPEGRPHVTPLLAIWLEGALYFCTGASERKAKNLAHNAQCILTTGNSALNEAGLDLVLEGEAVRVTDAALLTRVAAAYEAKYGSDWHFDVSDGGFNGGAGNVALVFAVAPITAFGFGKGTTSSQTRWRFRQ